jgi:hypothetical protein
MTGSFMDTNYNGGCTPRVLALERDRQRALHSGDSKRYAFLCNSLGVDPESPSIYQEGMDSLNIVRTGENSELDTDYLKRVGYATLIRFPELERGESIGVGEIKKKLGRIRNAGYEVPPYSKLSKEEAWNLLRSIRGEVSSLLRRNSPGILEEITLENERRKDVRNFR